MSIRLPTQGDEPIRRRASVSLYSLVYCSRVAAGVDAAAVDRIIETSRRHNPTRGITGLLVVGSGIFFQWLEGPRDSVLELMALIESDSRHHSVVTLSTDEELDERLFGEWDMELASGDDIRIVLEDALEDAQTPASAKALRDMLEHLDSGGLDGIGQQ